MSTSTGLAAESAAATYLEEQGLRIIERNWRNRWCEIDLVAGDKAGVTHIIEVKYRRSTDFGSGFDYITADKIKRLRRAATAWMTERGRGGGVQIGAVAVTGNLDSPQIDYLPSVTD